MMVGDRREHRLRVLVGADDLVPRLVQEAVRDPSRVGAGPFDQQVLDDVRLPFPVDELRERLVDDPLQVVRGRAVDALGQGLDPRVVCETMQVIGVSAGPTDLPEQAI